MEEIGRFRSLTNLYDDFQAAVNLFTSAVKHVASSISRYVKDPDKDFTRSRKLSADTLITFLVSQGSSSTKNEISDFFGMDAAMPTASVLEQQRAKLKPEALEEVFRRFNVLAEPSQPDDTCDLIAADGSTFTFFSRPRFASDDYFVSEGHSAKGFTACI